jgi:hypothetical protein
VIHKNKPTIPRPTKAEWYYERQGLGVGPVAEHELRRAAREGYLTPDTLVWRLEFDDWKTAAHVPAIVAILTEAKRQSGIVHAPRVPSAETWSRVRSSSTQKPPPATDEASDSSNVVSTAERKNTLPASAYGLHDAVSEEEAREHKVDAGQVQEVLEHATRSGRWTQSSIVVAASERRLFPASRELAVPLWIVVTLAPIVLVFAGFYVLAGNPKVATDVSSPAATRPAQTTRSLGVDVRLQGQESERAGAKPKQVVPRRTGGTPPGARRSHSHSVEVTEGPLDAALFERRLRRALPVFDSQCWDRLRVPVGEVAPDPSVRIEFEVDPWGMIHNIVSSRPPAGYRGVGRCIVGRIRGWTFPRADEPTRVVATVVPVDL